jgi:hypothetical protein
MAGASAAAAGSEGGDVNDASEKTAAAAKRQRNDDDTKSPSCRNATEQRDNVTIMNALDFERDQVCPS